MQPRSRLMGGADIQRAPGTGNPRSWPFMRLAPEDHRLIALWAAECAARALPCFEERYPDDPRPRAAVEAVTGWAHHQLELPVVRQSSFAAFAAARKDERGAASLAALAAGHAAASAQKLRHA